MSQASQLKEVLDRLRSLDHWQRHIDFQQRANGRKLDLLLAKAATEAELQQLTAQLSADDAELQAAIDAAKDAATKAT